MKTLEYKIDIAADRRKVWDTMLQPETYKEWTAVSWPGSGYDGKWAQGEDIKFVSPEGGGTKAHIDQLKPYESMLATHVAVIQSDGSEDTSSDIAKGWVGTKEQYFFDETDGTTNLLVRIETTPEWASMFDEGWPAALKKLKEISEN